MKSFLLIAFLSLVTALSGAEIRHGELRTEHLASTILRDNRVGLDPNRLVKVYLPPGYADSGKAYPVIYFFHSIGWSAEQAFADGNLVRLIERGFASGVVPDFIFVVADFSVPGSLGSMYENSTTSGRWRDFITDELVPFIDGRFRTLRQSGSRGLAGDFMGGRGALELAMQRADLFGSVYALHPVATGTGELPLTYLEIDWAKVRQAHSLAELTGGRTQIFVQISQAFLPNPDRPPFYCDFPVEIVDGRSRLNPELNRKMQQGFILEESLDRYGANLRSLRGVAFDWGRYDQTTAHVFANRIFSRKLDDLGVNHEAEEYNGSPWNRTWTADGRFATRLLPFFARHLQFE